MSNPESEFVTVKASDRVVGQILLSIEKRQRYAWLAAVVFSILSLGVAHLTSLRTAVLVPCVALAAYGYWCVQSARTCQRYGLTDKNVP